MKAFEHEFYLQYHKLTTEPVDRKLRMLRKLVNKLLHSTDFTVQTVRANLNLGLYPSPRAPEQWLVVFVMNQDPMHMGHLLTSGIWLAVLM